MHNIGQVEYICTKKIEEAAIALAEFNSVFPNDTRFQETTLLIAESAVNFAPKDQLCDILKQSLEFMVNPSDKFVKRINILKNEKQYEWMILNFETHFTKTLKKLKIIIINSFLVYLEEWILWLCYIY